MAQNGEDKLVPNNLKRDQGRSTHITSEEKEEKKKQKHTYLNSEWDKKIRHDHHADILCDGGDGQVRVERNITHRTDEELSWKKI